MIEVGIFEADKSYFSLFLNLAEIVNLAKKIRGYLKLIFILAHIGGSLVEE